MFVKNLTKALTLAAISLIALPTSAYATLITYDFGITNFGASFLSADQNHSLRENNPSSVESTVTYNTETLTAIITLSGEGFVRDVNNGNTTIVNPTDFFAELTVNNVTPILAPEGLLGFAGNNASSNGFANVSNFGDVTGDGIGDNVSFDIEAKFMNFARFAGTASYRSELAALGSSNFFLFDSTILNGIAANAWFASSNFTVNGNSVSGVSGRGDIHLRNGQVTGAAPTEVPEPATALLLTFGLLGGMIQRRKN